MPLVIDMTSLHAQTALYIVSDIRSVSSIRAVYEDANIKSAGICTMLNM